MQGSGYGPSMHASKPKQRVRFKAEVARDVGAKLGLTTDAELAAYFNVNAATFSRVINGVTTPGEVFIAAVLGSHPDLLPFDLMFEIVEVAA